MLAYILAGVTISLFVAITVTIIVRSRHSDNLSSSPLDNTIGKSPTFYLPNE